MCTASIECSDKSVCVAGRCQLDKPNVKPAVDSSRRVVVKPVDISFVSRASTNTGALPTVFVLGKDGGKLLLRFSVSLPKSSNIIEAYVVLRRATVVDDDPNPISLHATRIVDSWSGGSVSWAIQPRSTETRSPSTLVKPHGSSIVRLDVRDLVRHWVKRDPNDHGIAILAEEETRSGSTFALSSVGIEDESSEGARTRAPQPVGEPDVEPYLELYVR